MFARLQDVTGSFMHSANSQCQTCDFAYFEFGKLDSDSSCSFLTQQDGSACLTLEDRDVRLFCHSMLSQMQVLWEMKALSDSVDLGLMAKARAIPEYKTDFNDLNMESIHVCSSIAASGN